jgi:putative peptidoglycan lipid II flippase
VLITLSGNYGFDNAGDEALLSAITASIRRLRPDAEFVVLSGAPEKTRSVHGIPAVYYLNPWRVLRAIQACDLLISGGGSIFQDVTSGRSLPYYISVVALACLTGKPVIFYAQGVGPINRHVSKFLMRMVANHANMITLRDQDSLEYLRALGVTRPPMRVTADPVFALEPEEADRQYIRQYLRDTGAGHQPLIGVALREWEPLEGFQSGLAALLDHYCVQGYQILFIPMAFPDDIAAGEKTAALMQSPALILREHFSSRQHLALISELELMIGMRLHALIFAASRGIPMAGVSYDPKIDAFLKMFDLEALAPDADAMQAQIDPLLQPGPWQEASADRAAAMRLQAAENAELALSLLNIPSPEAEEAAKPEPDIPAAVTGAATGTDDGSTGRNFISVAVAIFFSKVLGFLRDVLFASTFGTTIIADAYQTIFGLPSLLFSSVGNALSSVNIPDLTYFLHRRTSADRQDYIANLFAQITLIFGLLSLAGIMLAPWITRLLAPGLETSAAQVASALFRIMTPCLLFVNLTYFSAGILQVHGFFLLSSLVSIPFNVLIILALFLRGDDIVFIGYMTTAGWFLQFFIQYPRLRRLGYRLRGGISFTEPHIKNIYRNLLPILLGNSVLQLCLIADRSFGTRLSEGTSSALAFGSNLFITITSVFVVAMSTVVFPRLSQYCLVKDYPRIRDLVSMIFQILLFILLPYLILIIAFHREIIMLVYERGAFDQVSTNMTASSFLFYSLSVGGYACQEIFNRVFYAFKQYRLPMLVSLLCVGINLALDSLLYQTYGIMGISLSTSACMLLYAGLMFCLLRRQIGPGMGASLLRFCLRLGVPLGVMLLLVLWGRHQGNGSLSSMLLTIVVSGGAYLAVAYGMGFGKILRRE